MEQEGACRLWNDLTFSSVGGNPLTGVCYLLQLPDYIVPLGKNCHEMTEEEKMDARKKVAVFLRQWDNDIEGVNADGNVK
jgi:hypothetical protein